MIAFNTLAEAKAYAHKLMSDDLLSEGRNEKEYQIVELDSGMCMVILKGTPWPHNTVRVYEFTREGWKISMDSRRMKRRPIRGINHFNQTSYDMETVNEG